MSGVYIELAPFGSALYDAAKALRSEVLRKPLGMTLSERDTEGEQHQRHIVARLDGQRVVGSVSLLYKGHGVFKLRQMAVAESMRGAGVGASLVRCAEGEACGSGGCLMELSARVSALKFYEKLGYSAYGETYIDVTLPHIMMQKPLT